MTYGLRWGLKQSFLDYIARMPDGRAAVGAGATAAGTHEILYPAVQAGRRPNAAGGEDRFWAFGGDVRFSGHFGMLSVRIAEPRIVLIDGEASLDIAGYTDGERLTLVTLSLTAKDDEHWTGTDVRLAAAGVEVFNDVYREGEPFEDLEMTLPPG